jgi:RNA polymerase sigma-70 factor, ECF subfamily
LKAGTFWPAAASKARFKYEGGCTMALSQVERDDRSDEFDLIRRAARKEETAIRVIIQAHNRRLYRVARSIVRDDGEAEDVLQEAYLRAFSSLAEFRGDSSLSTWLTRIVLNEAFRRLRRHTERPVAHIYPPSEANVIPFPFSDHQPADPERAMAQRQLCELVERAIDGLAQEFRTVLVARVIEGMTVEETADLLGLRPETVKTRLHRARRLLKVALADHIGPLFSDVFPFEGERCERITNALVKRLNLSS